MWIGTDYGTVFQWIWLKIGLLMYLYVIHVLLIFHVIIFNSF